MRTRKRNRYLRAAVQLFFFIVMPGAFVAGFNGVKRIFLWSGAGQVLQLDSFVLSLIGLCAFTILFGRFFCGYVCAFGSLGDAVYALSGLVQKKLFKRKKQFAMPQQVCTMLQKLKYVILAGIIVLCATGIYSQLTGWNPWEVFSRLTSLKLPQSGSALAIVIFAAILVGMALQQRFFCQFLCPMGAVFALLPVLPFSILHREEDSCIKTCNACKNTCPVSLKMHKTGVRDGECIACDACMDICPKGNLSRTTDRILPHRWMQVTVKAVLFFIMGMLLGFSRF